MTYEVTCPECGHTFEVENPTRVKKARGQLAGIALSDMTDEQLKIAARNATSALYKAKKRGADATEQQARLDAIKAEKASRGDVYASDADTSDEDTSNVVAPEVEASPDAE